MSKKGRFHVCPYCKKSIKPNLLLSQLEFRKFNFKSRVWHIECYKKYKSESE